jgi:hypothetical protein
MNFSNKLKLCAPKPAERKALNRCTLCKMCSAKLNFGNFKLEKNAMIGWGKGTDWDKAYEFFAKGNEWTYKELLKNYK